MNKKQAKIEMDKAFSKYRKTKGKAAKAKARAAALIAQGKYGAAVSKERMKPKSFSIELDGQKIEVIEKRGEFFFVGEFDSKTEREINRKLAEMFNLEKIKDEQVYEKSTDLALVAEFLKNVAA